MIDKKTQILENALKMFLEYDYAGTSISKIASSVGLSKSTFFNYFKSKDELFNEVFLMCKSSANRVSPALKYTLEHFEEMYLHCVEHKNEMLFINRFEFSEHITEESRQKGISMNSIFYNDIVEGQKNGSIVNLPPIYLCLLISNALLQSIDFVVEDEKINKEKLKEVKKIIERILNPS